MSRAEPIGVGIVGLSAGECWAARAHLPALAGLDGFELRALSASSAASARAAGERHGIALTFGSAEELARCDAVDLVVVAVKVPHHREAIEAAAAAGKAVFSEWPLGVDLAEAEYLARLARDSGIGTAIGLQGRAAPALRYVRDLIADGFVGEVLSSSMISSGGVWGATYADGGEYLLDAANGATLLSIPFGHTVDALTMVLGDVADVTATTTTRRPVVHHAVTGAPAAMSAPDQVAVTALLDSGAVASLHFRGGRFRATDFHWEINGTDGDIVVSADSHSIWMRRIVLSGARGPDTELTELAVPESYRTLPQFTGRETEAAHNVAYVYAGLLRDWGNAGIRGAQATADFDHAVRTHELLDRVRTAALRRG